MKIVSVVGARPEFVQVAALCRVLRRSHDEVLVHTGQHYDDRMSKVFFDELGLPTPEHDLGVGSGSHAAQTAAMLVPMEELFVAEAPDVVIIRGDTNSTLAAALVAAKLCIPLAHVEAGERSFVRAMPEEINRVVADRLSSMFLCVSSRSVENLRAEGITEHVHRVGDVMYDALLHNLPRARERSTVLSRLGLERGEYYLATVHRADNTGDAARLTAILDGLGGLDRPVVLPLHPRTAAALQSFGLSVPPNVRVTDPLGYFDMLVAEESARAIGTDSGGVQREAYCLGVPCVTLRDETEWTETVDAGWNRLTGADARRIQDAFASAEKLDVRPDIFGDGTAAEKILAALEHDVPKLRG